MNLERTVAQELIRRAARHAPRQLAERLEEEWLADLAARRGGGVSNLRFAIGCWWAARVIAADYVTAAVPAATSVSGQHALTACRSGVPHFVPGRGVILVVIVALHVALILGLTLGLGTAVQERLPPSLIATFKQLVPRPLEPSPLPPKQVTFRRFEIDDPTQPLPIDLSTKSEAAVAGDVSQPETPTAATAAADPASRLQGGPGLGFPNADEFYPPGSIRLREAGSAKVHVCVNTAGRLTAAPMLAESTGFPRLDAGALKLARAGSGRYRPTLENGEPVDACYLFRITFSLR